MGTAEGTRCQPRPGPTRRTGRDYWQHHDAGATDPSWESLTRTRLPVTAVNDQMKWVQRTSIRFVVLAEQRASHASQNDGGKVDQQLNA
jgi:hypothetical protein